ncbi:uncharacterized protein LOC135212964 isoform X2 [Macrobrachium nipponense]
MESTDYEAYEDYYFTNCTSDDQNCTADLSEPLGTKSISKILFRSLLELLALIGSIYAIRLLANMTTKYILSRYVVTRALASILMLLMQPFDLVTDFNGSWIFGHVLCKGRNFLEVLSGYVVCGMQVGMCINTYIEESKSTPNSKLRSTAFKITSIVSWFFSLSIGIFIYKRSKVVRIQESAFCIVSIKVLKNFSVLAIIMGSIVPITFSWVLLRLAVSHKKTQPAMISLEEPASVSWILQKRSKQLSFAITTSFTIFSVVSDVMFLMIIFDVEGSTLSNMFSISDYLFPISVIVDLALYTLFMRDAYKHLKNGGTVSG